MLVQLFPRHIIEVLGINGLGAVPEAVSHLAHQHEDVTILFMDIVGFTNMSKLIHPVQVMQFLNELFSIIDDLAELHGVQKVETAGEV
jgi:class 3 adenylate cyclase